MGTVSFPGATGDGACGDLPGMTLHVGNCGDTLQIVVRQEGQGNDELIASMHLHKDMTPHIIENIAIYGQADRTQVAAIMQAGEFLYQYEPPTAERLRDAIANAAGPDEWVTMLENNGRQYAAVVPRRIAAAGQGALEGAMGGQHSTAIR